MKTRFQFSDLVYRLLPGNFFLSIRARVILSYLVIVGLGLLYLVRQVTNNVRPRYLEVLEETMVDVAQVMAGVAEPSYREQEDRLDPTLLREAFRSARSHDFTARIYELTKQRIDLRVYVTDAAGRVVFDSDHGKAEGEDYSQKNDVYLTLRGRYGARSTRRDKSDPASSVLFVAAPIRHGDAIVGVATVSKPLTSVAAFMERTRTRILLLGAAAAAGVALAGLLFSAWLTYPIRNLIDYAKAIRDGRRAPLPNLGHSEIRTLGVAFEEMRDVVEGKDYVRRYVQTLTHEMKSPVAAIQGAAELLEEEMPPAERRRFLANIRMETARLQEGIDSLLLLASVESKKTLDRVAGVDLRELLGNTAQRIAARAGLKSIAVMVVKPAGPDSVPLCETAVEPAIVQGDFFCSNARFLISRKTPSPLPRRAGRSPFRSPARRRCGRSLWTTPAPAFPNTRFPASANVFTPSRARTPGRRAAAWGWHSCRKWPPSTAARSRSGIARKEAHAPACRCRP